MASNKVSYESADADILKIFRKISASPTIKFIYYFVLLCIMEIISFKVDDDLAREIEKAMKPFYATKTEFIREALRKHLKYLEREALIKQMMTFKGSIRKNITDADLRKTREEVSEELLREFGLKK
jgi:Arc/MetJ-type ribon-helix-helix transcriptional regulator